MTQITVTAAELDLLRSVPPAYLRQPSDVTTDRPGGDEYTATWTPDLTATEVQRAQSLRALIRSAIRVTPDEWQAIEGPVATLRAFRTRSGNPTNAQVIAAVDALIDVLRVMLRD